MNSFSTIYRQDYVLKKINRVGLMLPKQEFSDPVLESFRKFLVCEPDVSKPEENVQTYLKQFTEDEKWAKITRNYIPDKSLDEDIIKQNLLTTKSTFQSDYVNKSETYEGDFRELIKQEMKGTITDDIVIPVTTQTLHYRHPGIIVKNVFKPRAIIRPLNNIVKNEKLGEINKEISNDSEYVSKIGNLGKLIVEEQVHGLVTKY